jgi:hypothetical protein
MPGGRILSLVATFAVYESGLAVTAVVSVGAAFRNTDAVIPDEQPVVVTVPFAQ